MNEAKGTDNFRGEINCLNLQNHILLLCKSWRSLCETYLPCSVPDSIWRFSRLPSPRDPAQGWKIHLSATILSAGDILQSVAPFLQNLRVLFKAPVSLEELMKINSGIYYGYCQVGKFITVYPQTEGEFISLAEELHRLIRKQSAPRVPFDFKFGSRSCVYYRFGAFKTRFIENPEGFKLPALQSPGGQLVADIRETASELPSWVTNPFPEKKPKRLRSNNPFHTSYNVFRSLSQRGKGGVYEAIDTNENPPRICLIKEGRVNGETDWSGRDGCWRVRNEARVLPILTENSVNAARVYESFEAAGNFYLVTESVEGENLQKLLHRRKSRLPISLALDYGRQIGELISKIHASGWVWRDCKPANIILTPRGKLRPVDFEGACPVNEYDPLPWSTPSFAPPEIFRSSYRSSNLPEDLFALGAFLFLLIEGQMPVFNTEFTMPKITRKNVPKEIKQSVCELLSENPALRPPAEIVAGIFNAQAK